MYCFNITLHTCVLIKKKKKISEKYLKKTLRIFPFISPACPNGLFGQDCSEKCNGTCAGCNHVSGVCDYGCIPGWMGHSCNQSIVYTISLSSDKNLIH